MKSSLHVAGCRGKIFLTLELWYIEHGAGLFMALCLRTFHRLWKVEPGFWLISMVSWGSLHGFSEQKHISLSELKLLI